MEVTQESRAVSELTFSPPLAFCTSGSSPPVTVWNPPPSLETGRLQPVPHSSVQSLENHHRWFRKGNKNQPGEQCWALLLDPDIYPRSVPICCCDSLMPDLHFHNTDHGDMPGKFQLFGIAAVKNSNHGHLVALHHVLSAAKILCR